MRLTKLHISTIVVTALLSAIVGFMLWLTPTVLRIAPCASVEWFAMIVGGVGAVGWVARQLSLRDDNGNGHGKHTSVE